MYSGPCLCAKIYWSTGGASILQSPEKWAIVHLIDTNSQQSGGECNPGDRSALTPLTGGQAAVIMTRFSASPTCTLVRGLRFSANSSKGERLSCVKTTGLQGQSRWAGIRGEPSQRDCCALAKKYIYEDIRCSGWQDVNFLTHQCSFSVCLHPKTGRKQLLNGR